MALAGGYGSFNVPSGAEVNSRFGSPQPTATGYSDYGDLYNRRAQAQQTTGDPYGVIHNSTTVRNPLADLYQQMLQGQANQNLFDFRAGLNQVGQQYGQGEVDRRYAGADYQNALDMLNWNRGNTAIDQQSAAQNLAYRDQIIGNLQQMFGINDRNLANQIAQSVLDQQVRASAASLAGLRESQQLRSSGIAGGSMFFPGQGIGQTQISDSTANTLRGINEGAGLTQEGYRIGAEKERLGLTNNILGQQQTRLSDADSLAKLNRMGERYGIEERGLLNKRNQNYETIAGQQAAALNQIKALRQSADANQRALAEQLAQALGIA